MVIFRVSFVEIPTFVGWNLYNSEFGMFKDFRDIGELRDFRDDSIRYAK